MKKFFAGIGTLLLLLAVILLLLPSVLFSFTTTHKIASNLESYQISKFYFTYQSNSKAIDINKVLSKKPKLTGLKTVRLPQEEQIYFLQKSKEQYAHKSIKNIDVNFSI